MISRGEENGETQTKSILKFKDLKPYNWILGADYDEETKQLALLFYNKILIFNDCILPDFTYSSINQINFDNFHKRSGIAIINSNSYLFVNDTYRDIPSAIIKLSLN